VTLPGAPVPTVLVAGRAPRAAADAAPPSVRSQDNRDYLAGVGWDERGLVAAIAQEVGSQRVLMLAWMNREALAETVLTGYATYWSRSRNRLWRKGEESGHRQRVHAVQIDCDGDAIVLQVTQEGGIACHTGRHSCFFRTLRDGAWNETEPVLRDPAEFYDIRPKS
jgi:phosphoribosyl-AMP cyclohydrolase